MIILTGGAGFIGSVFLKKLNNEQINDIIVVDEFDTSDKWKNLLNKSFRYYIHKDDFINKIINNDIKDKISAIIHLGACSNTTENDMDYLYKINTNYSRILLNYALEKNIRFIYASSAAVYGNGELGFDDNDNITPKLKPMNKYGFSKWLFDNYIFENKLSGSVVGLRFFNVFGPNEYHKGPMRSVIFNAYFEANTKNKISLFKSNASNMQNGEQKRDFIYIKDVVDIIYYFLENTKINGIFNVGTGKANSFNTLAEFIFKNIGKKRKISYFSMPEKVNNQYQNFTQAEINKLRSAGYLKDFTPFEESIKDYLVNYLMKKNSFF